MNLRLVLAVPMLVLTMAWAGCNEDSGKDCGGDGCGAAPTADATRTGGAKETAGIPPRGVSHATLTHYGLSRSYRMYLPDLPNGSEVPLVVALHGGLGSGDQFAGASRFEALAASEGFVVVFPDGIERTWNGGNCCGQAARRKIDDVGFLAALIEKLAGALPIDRSRVFMTGHSNGAIMSFRFGCEGPGTVRAIAPVAGSLEIPKCQPKTATSLLAVHGDSDQNHPLEGGEGSRSIAGVPFVSMEKSLALWTAGMKCGTSQRLTAGALTTASWDGCRDGVQTRFIVIAGADHPWPGGNNGGASVPGRTSDALDATKVVWEFFESLE